jgi:phage shock protein C
MVNEAKRLYRSRSERMIAGVAGGLGEFLTIDPTIMRLIFVFSLFLGGTGLFVYLVMWLVVPEEPGAAKEEPKKAAARAAAPKKAAAPKSSAAKRTSSAAKK